MTRKLPLLYIITFMASAATIMHAQNVTLVVTGIRSVEGQIALGIFRDNESFQKEEAYLELRFEKKDISNGGMRVQFSLGPGIYGIALLDDENSNRKMEYNFLGIPKEGFGFSDYYHTGFTKPKFESFKFSIGNDQKKMIAVRIRYMLK